jgi:hypothetical protein
MVRLSTGLRPVLTCIYQCAVAYAAASHGLTLTLTLTLISCRLLDGLGEMEITEGRINGLRRINNIGLGMRGRES